MRVSVICPVFNTRPDLLRAAVQSALAQENEAVHEVILIDDCSTSRETRAALDELSRAHLCVTVLRLPSNSGPAAARNLGLAHASGDWIGFLDADDLWPSDKLTRASLALLQRADAQWIIGDIANFHSGGRDPIRPGAPCFPEGDGAGPPQCSPKLTRCIILEGLHLGACIVKRTQLANMRFNPAALYGEDLLFLAKLSLSTCADRAPGLSYLCRRGHESMMYSSARISARYASGPLAGFRDPELRDFRREYRWALYGLYKGLAVNNLLNDRPLTGLRFALSALRLDPREIIELMRFITLLPYRNRAKLALRARHYSQQEQVILFNQLPSDPEHCENALQD